MKSARLGTRLTKTGPPPRASRVSRVMQIVTALQTGKGYTVDELARLFGISKRTLFRDFKEIQNIGIQPKHSPTLNQNAERKYVIPQTAENNMLPPVNLNLQEALGLLLLVHKMRRTIQLPFKNSALLGAMKIESILPPRIRSYCEQALAKISARTTAQASLGTGKASAQAGFDSVFSSLQSALAMRCKVRIRYDSLFDGGVIDCVLSPYHLFYNQRAWYIVGRSSIHNTLRTFKLNRIKDIAVLDDTVEGGEDFNLVEYIGRAWSMIPEGKIYNVRLRFMPKVANNVAEVQWHNSQKVTWNDDGSAEIEFCVDGLGEITWWILGYGDQVEILAPAILRKRIVEIAHKMVEINNGSNL